MPYVKVAEVDEIAVGQGTLIERDGLAIAVFNGGGGQFYATSPTCPHEDGRWRRAGSRATRSSVPGTDTISRSPPARAASRRASTCRCTPFA